MDPAESGLLKVEWNFGPMRGMARHTESLYAICPESLAGVQ